MAAVLPLSLLKSRLRVSNDNKFKRVSKISRFEVG